MANIVPDSFKTDLLGGTFDFDSSGGSTFKLALYTSIAGFSTATTAYTTTNEVSSSGTNYTAGGNTLTNNGVAISSNIAYVDFADSTFSSVTLTPDIDEMKIAEPGRPVGRSRRPKDCAA